MRIIWHPTGAYKLAPYKKETDLEAAIQEVKEHLFGKQRLYFDLKKIIGVESKSIPDGYLLDLTGKRPRLFVVENELASHEPLQHIAVQLLRFSIAFKETPHTVKQIVSKAIEVDSTAKTKCAEYARAHGFENHDRILEYLVHESPFAALVIIDEVPKQLESVLAGEFTFGVEVLQLARFESASGEHVYQFEPFLSDVIWAQTKTDVSDIDTIVVSGREDDFEEVFMAKREWHIVPVHGAVRPQLKYIAVYRNKPTSAITHVAPIEWIRPTGDRNYVNVCCAETPEPIGPIKLGKKPAIRGPRYTSLARLKQAKSTDDI